jgi:hypothetical protein
LANWPIQLRLVPPHAPFLQNAEVLLVADCVPFALADFHRRFMDGKPVLVACPKLDDAAAYVQKLAQILREANLRRLQVLHVDLPCCLGLRSIAEAAVGLAGVDLEVEPVVVTRQGECYEDATAARGIPARLAPAG